MRLLAAGLIVAAAVAAPAAAGTAAPTLRLGSVQPLVLRGAHFERGESVRVVVSDSVHRWARRARVTAAGTFSVSFGAVPIDRCTMVAAAFGSRGDRASRKPAAPACIEPIGP